MRAIDTNVVVRFLTADDRRQAEAARAVFAAGDIYIVARMAGMPVDEATVVAH